MAYDGKRSARMRIPTLVNMDPELGAEIRAGAAREVRPIGLHIVVLLTEAVIARRRTVVHERRGTGVHCCAESRADAHLGAPPRMAAHVEERKDGTNGD
jgi:hypothetical protein